MKSVSEGESNESAFIILHALLNTKLVKKMDFQLNVHGISFTEYMIMRHLNNAVKRTMRRIELAECVGISASGVTRLLAPMEKNKIVEKEINPRDARVSLVRLTKTGERLYKESSVSFEHSAKTLTGPLSAIQLEKMVELSNKLL